VQRRPGARLEKGLELRCARLLALLVALSIAAVVVPYSGRAVAQDGSDERIIVDVATWSFPSIDGSGASHGHCVELEVGQLSITLQLIGEPPPVGDDAAPVTFSFVGWRGIDGPATTQMRLTRVATTVVVPLAGGLYCYSVDNVARLRSGASSVAIGDATQMAAVRLALRPEPWRRMDCDLALVSANSGDLHGGSRVVRSARRGRGGR
jgi:hypothetical protein